ncbi:hypothetical protein FML25_05645 [Klebsiella oxytoca]|uniref:hypothetical protein n=1 Tax=Klebsiella oxytoca TaxID=571 RepID=UPI001CCBE9DD|nr:hypothetical protein [Klebsiella oxytoca]MBZ7064205.1 hypothetical protein [Klebsiella oxytoca]MBZ7152634.1 hypothetical protein [Klebsiella oxytoca]MBZ7687449.1 hypothetical protein [Klebsiella oxytoca]MBZ7761674.1 hypothetical protein [Klebsiella oxytoca]MCW9502670.1 hypothetical protein [Klebsiella oxytoca]
MVRQRTNWGRAHSDRSAGIPGGGAAGPRLARATGIVLILTVRLGIPGAARQGRALPGLQGLAHSDRSAGIPGGGAVGPRLARATGIVLILTVRRGIPGGGVVVPRLARAMVW